MSNAILAQTAANEAYAEAQIDAYAARLVSTERHREAYTAAIASAKFEGATGEQAVAAAKAASGLFNTAYNAARDAGQNSNQATHTAAHALRNAEQPEIAKAPAAQVDRQNVGLALRQARHTYRLDRPMLNAVNKVALNLEACAWQWDGVTLAIESATEVGTVTHRLSEREACTCKAGQKGRVCWAYAALQLLVIAGQLAARPRMPRMTEEQYRDMVDALNADLF